MLGNSFTLVRTPHTNRCAWWHFTKHVYAIRAFLGATLVLLGLLLGLSIRLGMVAEDIVARSTRAIPVAGTLYVLDWTQQEHDHHRWASNLTYSFVWNNQTQWGHSMFRDQSVYTSSKEKNALMSVLFSTYRTLPQATTVFVEKSRDSFEASKDFSSALEEEEEEPPVTSFLLQRNNPMSLVQLLLPLFGLQFVGLLACVGWIMLATTLSSVYTSSELVPAFRMLLYPLRDNLSLFCILCGTICACCLASACHMGVVFVRYIRLPECQKCTHPSEMTLVLVSIFVPVFAIASGGMLVSLVFRTSCCFTIVSPLHVRMWKDEASQFWDTEPSHVYIQLVAKKQMAIRQITLCSELYTQDDDHISWERKRAIQLCCGTTVLEANSETYLTCAFALSEEPVHNPFAFWKLCLCIQMEDGLEKYVRVQVHTQQVVQAEEIPF